MSEKMNGHARDCSRDGHQWIDAPEPAIVAKRCIHCPAIGAPCPECLAVGKMPVIDDDGRVTGIADCSRCGATGTIEVVEIALREVQRLRLTERRFGWCLKEMAFRSESSPVETLREVDECLAIGAGEGKIGMRSVAELLQADRKQRAKTPRNG